MNKGSKRRMAAFCMLVIISISLIPFSALHRHEHVCDTGSDLPLQFRKEKDQAKHHYHSLQEDCFICSHALLRDYALFRSFEPCISDYIFIDRIQISYSYLSNTPVCLNNKAPPASLS